MAVTDEVLAAARKGLQAELDVVRQEVSRLAAAERALTKALSSLDGDGSTASSTPARAERGAGRTARSGSRGRPRKSAAVRRRRTRRASKSTAERVVELRGHLAEGPKSRGDLASALKVSPARVQQLLAELGGSVTSQPDPQQRQGKLWSLKGGRNGASPATQANGGSRAKAPARKRSARKPAASK